MDRHRSLDSATFWFGFVSPLNSTKVTRITTDLLSSTSVCAGDCGHGLSPFHDSLVHEIWLPQAFSPAEQNCTVVNLQRQQIRQIRRKQKDTRTNLESRRSRMRRTRIESSCPGSVRFHSLRAPQLASGFPPSCAEENFLQRPLLLCYVAPSCSQLRLAIESCEGAMPPTKRIGKTEAFGSKRQRSAKRPTKLENSRGEFCALPLLTKRRPRLAAVPVVLLVGMLIHANTRMD